MSSRGQASQSIPPRSDAVSPEGGLPIQVRRDVHVTGLEGSLSLILSRSWTNFCAESHPLHCFQIACSWLCDERSAASFNFVGL